MLDSQKDIWLQADILEKLQMVGLFLSNDKLNVLRIGIRPFHAFFPENFDFSNFFISQLIIRKIRVQL